MISNYSFFKVEIADYIALVSFNRPDKSNALHREAWHEMKTLFDTLSDLSDVRVIILSGEGKHFCSA